MKAVAIFPGKPHSVHCREVDSPRLAEGSVLCRMLAVGVCGTDLSLVRDGLGTAPADDPYLIIGHEALGEVVDAPADSGLTSGDVIAGIVRRPDPVPCPSCANGEWDMCQNGRYTERGIKERHGFCSEYFRIEPEFAVPLPAQLRDVGVLMEPASIVAKAWEQSRRIASRSTFQPSRALVAGAGPIGLLAALMGVQGGYRVHVFDRCEDGPKPDLVRALGATYHTTIESVRAECGAFDLMFECTGAPSVIASLLTCSSPNGILCLTGVSSGGRTFPVDIGELNRDLVLENDVIFGTVNANRRHFAIAADVLERADRSWLQRLITRRVPFEHWEQAYDKREGDIKTVIIGSGASIATA